MKIAESEAERLSKLGVPNPNVDYVDGVRRVKAVWLDGVTHTIRGGTLEDVVIIFADWYRGRVRS